MLPGPWRPGLTGSTVSHKRWTQLSDCETSGAAAVSAGTRVHAEFACEIESMETINPVPVRVPTRVFTSLTCAPRWWR